MRPRVVVCDLGLGNLRSVERALSLAAAARDVKVDVVVSSDAADIASAAGVVVPGQGAFRDGSAALVGALGNTLRETIARGTPYLGICLGLQLLFDGSEESPGARGLGVFKGTSRRLQRGEGANAVKIPHMGWNELVPAADTPDPIRRAFAVSPWVYFVHSFHAVPDDRGLVCATAGHGVNDVTAAVHRGNVLATQFHPEKSHAAGLALLGAFLEGTA